MMLEPVITESAAGVSMIAILALLALLGMLLGAVVLVGVLLANRHTRGVGLGLLAAGGIGLVLLATWISWGRIASHDSHSRMARHETQMAMEQEIRNAQDAMPEVTTHDHTAESIAEYGTDRPMSADASTVGTLTRKGIILLPVALLALLLALALLYIAFKHGGPVVGFGLLCLPVLLAFFYLLIPVESSQVTYSRTDSVSYGPPSVDPPEIASPSYAIPLEATEDPTPEEAETVEETKDPDEASTTKDNTADTAEETTKTKAPTLPDWIDTPAKQVGNVYRQSLQVGPFATAGECQKHMDREIDHALTQYISHIALEEHGGTTNNCPSIAMLHISPQYVRENIIREEYYETVVSSVSDNMKTLHLLLEIDNRAHHSLMEYWRAYTQKSRVFLMTGIAGSLLALLAGILGLMKLDTYTKGFYTKRLFIGVPLAIIGLLLLLVA